MTGGLRLSAVITSYRRPERLERCIRPLLDDARVHEVVVVDDASGDGSATLLTEWSRREPRLVPVLLHANVGQPRARAAGVAASAGEVVLSLDDDVVVEPGTAGGHLARHEERANRVVLGYMPTHTPTRRGAGQFATVDYAAAYERTCENYRRDPGAVLVNFWGGNFSVRRADFQRLFAEYAFPLRYHEDRDLGLWMRKGGLDPVFDEHLLARHEHRRAFTSFVQEGRSAGAGAIALHRLHGDLLGPMRADDVLWEARPSVALLGRASDLRAVRVLALAAVDGAVRVLGRRQAWDLELRIAGVGKVLGARQGAREGQAATLSPGRLPVPPSPREAEQGPTTTVVVRAGGDRLLLRSTITSVLLDPATDEVLVAHAPGDREARRLVADWARADGRVRGVRGADLSVLACAEQAGGDRLVFLEEGVRTATTLVTAHRAQTDGPLLQVTPAPLADPWPERPLRPDEEAYRVAHARRDHGRAAQLADLGRHEVWSAPRDVVLDGGVSDLPCSVVEGAGAFAERQLAGPRWPGSRR